MNEGGNRRIKLDRRPFRKLFSTFPETFKDSSKYRFIICFLRSERSLSASSRGGGVGIRDSVPRRLFPDLRRGFRTPVRAAFRPASDLCRDLGSRQTSPLGARIRPYAPGYAAIPSGVFSLGGDAYRLPSTRQSIPLCLPTSGVSRPLSALP